MKDETTRVRKRRVLKPGGDWPYRLPDTRAVMVEWACQVPDESLLNVLWFPRGPLLPQDAHLTSAYWAHGASHEGPSEVGELINEVKRSGANEIQTELRFRRHRLAGADAVLIGITACLKVSAMNSIWARLPDRMDVGTREDRRTLSNFAVRETGVRWRDPPRDPSVFACLIEIDSASDGRSLTESFASLLAESFPVEMKALDVVGMGFVDGEGSWFDWFPSQARHLLGTKLPRVFATQFPQLPRVVIGPGALVEGVVRAVGEGAYVRRAPHELDIAVGVLPEKPSVQAHERARPYVFQDEDIPPPRELDPALGEFRTGPSNVLFTLRRLRELIQRGAMEMSKGHSLHPFIAASYCEVLGIDPQDMVAMVAQTQIWDLYRNRVNNALDALPPEMPAKERIWQAHDAALRKVFSARTRDFIGKRYFNIEPSE